MPQMQRMLIGAGCYSLTPHGRAQVDAYCLDQSGSAPPQGAILGTAPPALGEATIMVDGENLSLQAALAHHVLRIEGTDTPDRLALVNTTGEALSFCVRRPVVVMGNGVGYSADLERIYGQIVDLLKREGQEAAPRGDAKVDVHAQVQRRVWDLVNEVDEHELAPPLPGSGLPAPPGSQVCTTDSQDFVVCTR
jgi:hypothetical protein